MKRTLTFVLILALLLPAVVADEGEALEDIQGYAEKIKELVDKYKKAEVDFVKQEVVTIKDESGNVQDCDVAIYYNNGKQARFTTKNGKFDNNFNHGKKVPTKPISVRLSNCACEPTEIKHSSVWIEINEQIEKIKEVVEDEITGYAQDKAKEFAEEATKKVFDKLGYGAAASGFLAGFGYGAALGAPIGDYITSNINKILDLATQQNLAVTQLTGDVAPLRPNVGWVKPRGGWGNTFGENPQLKNTWDITVKCGGNVIGPADATWTEVKRPKIRPPLPPEDEEDEEYEEDGESEADKRARERAEREEKAREDRERREREAREKQEKEEARKRYEEKLRKLRLKAQEIAKTCPLCDPIRKQIEELNEKIKDKEQKIPGLETSEQEAQDALDKANRKLAQAKRKLSEFRNPQSYVASGGRTVTTTDIEVQRQLSIDNWNAYQRNEQTAEETMENWDRQSDPATHAQAKKDAEKRLENDVKKAEQNVKDAQDKLNKAKQEVSKCKQRLKNMQKELADLQKKLEDCLKLCKKYALDIAKGRISDAADLFEHHEYYSTPPAAPAAPVVDQTSKPKTQCERYEQMVALATKGRLNPTEWSQLRQEIQRQFTGPGMIKAIKEAKELCDKEGGAYVQVSQQPVVSQPQTFVQTPQVISQQPEQPTSCPDVCAQKGMTTQKPDWTSHILQVLNSQGQCRSSAHIQFPQTVIDGSCACYSTQQPAITISSEPLICRGTACGDVACGQSTSCSCGERCTATVTCGWGGWKQIGEKSFQAVAGVQKQEATT